MLFDITLFFVLPFEELIGLLKTLVLIGMIYFTTVVVRTSPGCQTSGVGQKTCLSLITFIYDWPLLLAPPLIYIIGGEEIIN